MFGPLGFNEIIFILVLGFLMLGPRQMALFSRTLGEVMGRLYRATADARRLFEEERRKLEDEMSDVTSPIRDAKQQWGSIKGDFKKSIDGVEQGLRQEKQALERQQQDVLRPGSPEAAVDAAAGVASGDEPTVDGPSAGDVAAGDAVQDAAATRDASLPEDPSRRRFLGDFEAPDGEASGDEPTVAPPEVLQVRTPRGQMARGSMAPDDAVAETAGAAGDPESPSRHEDTDAGTTAP